MTRSRSAEHSARPGPSWRWHTYATRGSSIRAARRSRSTTPTADCARGVQLLVRDDVATHVIVSASTDGGLEQLAEAEGASVIVFGSDYRTAPGRAEPGNTAQRLLDGGKVAVAVAAAGRRLHPDEPIRSIGVATDDVDGSVREIVDALAAKLGASAVVDAGERVDLIVVGSQANAPEGRIALGGSARAALNSSRGSVLVLPKGRTTLV